MQRFYMSMIYEWWHVGFVVCVSTYWEYVRSVGL